METLWCLIKNGYIESRKSLVLGHLSVAYGMGAVLLTLILVRFQQAKLWKIFLIAFVSGTVTEYICSPGQEICFGTVAWDYSHLPFEKVIVWAFIAFFVFDCALSASAALRMNERAQGIAASNKVEQFLDTYYPDDKMNQIYANSRPSE